MKKLVVFLIIVIGLIYFTTGRYATLSGNIQSKGIMTLIEEPKWLWSWTKQKWKNALDDLNSAIDGKPSKRGEQYAQALKNMGIQEK